MESVITRMVNCGAVEILRHFSDLMRCAAVEPPDLGLEPIRPITCPWPAVPNPALPSAKPAHPCILEDKLSGLEPQPLW